MTLKEKRKHIKPYLRYALNYYNKIIQFEKAPENLYGLCEVALFYANEIKEVPLEGFLPKSNELSNYIRERLNAAKPDDAEDDLWWNLEYFVGGKLEFGNTNVYKPGIQKRIDFCKLQLKIVKE